MSGQRLVRLGFTLLELLIVIGIIAVLLALTAVFFPNFQSQSTVASGADTTAGALLIAKMRAKRDGRPTGLRLTVNTQQSGGYQPLAANQYNQLTPIQQPDDFASGRYTGPQSGGGSVATFALPSGVSFTGNVNSGDYLELNGGGLLYQISVVGANTLTVADNVLLHPLPTATTDVNPNVTTSNYRIIRAPQVLSAEPPINLPVGVIIDLGSYTFPNATTGTPLSQVPYQIIAGQGNYDILFSPAGGLAGLTLPTGTTGSVFLVLRQSDGSNTTPYGSDLTAYYATIIAVEPHTGFIAAQPVAPGSDPYAYTRDGQSSGM